MAPHGFELKFSSSSRAEQNQMSVSLLLVVMIYLGKIDVVLYLDRRKMGGGAEKLFGAMYPE